MKLYDGGRAPNPRRVRIFLAEKGIEIEKQQIDIGALEHKGPAYTALNPMQQVPTLVLDDGTVITESIAICRYFEALNPSPAMFGVGALEQAVVEMWNRRLEQNLFFPVSQVFRHPHSAMKKMEVPQVAAWGEANKARVAAFLPILDRQLEIGPFVCGARYSIADITAVVAIDFMKPAKLAAAPEHRNIARWHAGISGRTSAAA